jgi:hypothetical protein
MRHVCCDTYTNSKDLSFLSSSLSQLELLHIVGGVAVCPILRERYGGE